MHRLFVALRPPSPIRDLLSDTMAGVPDARWQDDDQLHLTLRFLGNVDGAQAEDIALALSRIAAPASTVRIAGVGSFARRDRVHSLWAGLLPTAPLVTLHQKIDRALVMAGLTPDPRAFVPHITLARLSRSAGGGAEIGRWLSDHANLASPAFSPSPLILFESILRPDGARYEARGAWSLDQRLANTPQAMRSPDAPDGSVL